MQRKKYLHFLMCLSLILFAGVMATPHQAQAVPYLDGWTLDLSSLGYGTYTNIDRVSVSGVSTVNQTFTTPGELNVGDSFTEFGQLNQLNYYTEPGGATNVHSFNNPGAGLYLVATGLTGEVTSVDNPSSPATTEFLYEFDQYPAGATIELYLDDDGGEFDPGDGTGTTLATFRLYAGNGVGSPGFLTPGGQASNGTTSVQFEFETSLPGVFLNSSGQDLSTLGLPYYLFIDTNNQILSGNIAFNPDGSGFTATINSDGQMNVGVVPEPGTVLLLGLGLLGGAFATRKRFSGRS